MKLAEQNADKKLAKKLIASGGVLSFLLTAGAPPSWAAGENLASTVPPTRPVKTTQESLEKKAAAAQNAFKGTQGSGTLIAMATGGKELGQCPLKHTSVTAKVSGYVSRVTVKQTFHNPFKDKIEAVYTFPLSETGAVDEMLMKVGDRTIHGTIKKREEAREIYEEARARGHVASLLDQERPNIFTQSVANIEPGKEVEITLQYIDLLPYEDGKYTFAFPTVVGPRFNPGMPIGKQGTGWSPDTTQVPDASNITPPVTPEGTRAGHDISIAVDIEGGVPISNLRSALHEVSITNRGNTAANVSLLNKSTIPNKDFVLSWNVAGDELRSGYLTYRDPKSSDKSGYFTVMLLPPKRVTPETVAPKEMVFLIDCSGSQHGKPIEKAKETLNYIIDHMNPQDSFQVISFNNGATKLFPKARQVSPQMREEAKRHIAALQANGGTWMGPAVEEVFKEKADKNRLRIVTFMTDGLVGNDMEILGLIKKNRGNSRWFSFGTGNSVNRFLIDGIAKEGGGEADYVLLNSSANEVGKKFYDRISSPVLTDVKVAAEGIEVKEMFPKEVSDVWAQKPLYIKGRYLTPGSGTITLTGFHAGQPYKQDLKVNFPESDAINSGIASIWARAKVDRLMSEDWFGAQTGNPNKEIKDEIVKTALDHHIMTQYTSFVAVEEKTVTKEGKLIKQVVPVEMPDGVDRESVFGEEKQDKRIMRAGRRQMQILANAAPPPPGLNLSTQAYRSSKGNQGYYHYSPGAFQGATNGPVRGALLKAPRPIMAGGGGGGSGWGQSSASKMSMDSSALPPTSMGKSIGAAGDSIYGDEGASGLPQFFTEKRRVKIEAEKQKKSVDESVLSKLDPKLRGLETLVKRGDPIRSGLNVKDGKVAIKVTLKENSKDILEILKKAGLEEATSINVQGNQFTVTGKISVEKLIALAKLPEVLKISPIH